MSNVRVEGEVFTPCLHSISVRVLMMLPMLTIEQTHAANNTDRWLAPEYLAYWNRWVEKRRMCRLRWSHVWTIKRRCEEMKSPRRSLLSSDDKVTMITLDIHPWCNCRKNFKVWLFSFLSRENSQKTQQTLDRFYSCITHQTNEFIITDVSLLDLLILLWSTQSSHQCVVLKSTSLKDNCIYLT